MVLAPVFLHPWKTHSWISWNSINLNCWLPFVGYQILDKGIDYFLQIYQNLQNLPYLKTNPRKGWGLPHWKCKAKSTTYSQSFIQSFSPFWDLNWQQNIHKAAILWYCIILLFLKKIMLRSVSDFPMVSLAEPRKT